jgi:cytoskeletal protein CcmA (bactofilin family)
MAGDVKIKDRREILGTVEGDLTLENAAVLSDSSDNTVTVTGTTRCRGECTFNCNLKTSSLEGDDADILAENLVADRWIRIKRGRLRVDGSCSAESAEVENSISIEEDLTCGKVRVGGSLDVGGLTKSGDIDVGGSLHTEGGIETENMNVGGSAEVGGDTDSERIEVGGKLLVKGALKAVRIEVGGSLEGKSIVNLSRIDVGGRASIAGGSIDDRIEVGGLFESSGNLKFNRMDVGGVSKIGGGDGKEIEVGGTFTSSGDLVFERIEVGGTVKIKGNGSGKSIEVGGTLDCTGDLDLSEDLEIGGKANVAGRLKVRNAEVGGILQALEISAEEGIEVSKLRTRKGARARVIELPDKGEAKGPLIAQEITIGEKCHVEDLYGGEIELRRNSRARNIQARTIEIESGCSVSGFIKYTDDIEIDEDVKLGQKPERVKNLPDPGDIDLREDVQ